MNDYFEKRRHEPYYKYVRTLLGLLSYNAKSICDVGSNGTDMISWLPCQEKVSIDIVNPLYAEGVQSIKADFLKHDFSRKFDIVTCFQVMEHIDDDQIHAFANKLMAITEHLLIVSVPYKWAKGACKWHKQDPVDESKFAEWFISPPHALSLKPVFSRVIYNGYKTGRLVVVFASNYISESLDALNETTNWLIRFNDNNTVQIFNKLKPYITSRISIQLRSTEGDFKILSFSDKNAEILQPDWIQKDGRGYVILSGIDKLELVAKATVDGQIVLNLSGMWTPKLFPYWIDYTKLTVNEEVVFDVVTPTWFKKPYVFNMNVKADEEIKIQYEWLPHRSDT
jgi:hypothetical protein